MENFEQNLCYHDVFPIRVKKKLRPKELNTRGTWFKLLEQLFVQDCLFGLTISTGHRAISGKKSSYVRPELFHNGHSCPALKKFYKLATS